MKHVCALTFACLLCQLGARLDVDREIADEALMPRRAATTVALPPAEAEEVAEYACSGVGLEKRRAASKQRMYQRRPLLCHVPGCGQALEPDGHPSSLRCTFSRPCGTARARLCWSPLTARSPTSDRICGMHLRAEVVLIDGGAFRHCQARL